MSYYQAKMSRIRVGQNCICTTYMTVCMATYLLILS